MADPEGMLHPEVQVASPLRRTLAQAAWIILVVWAAFLAVRAVSAAADEAAAVADCSR